MWFNRIWFHNCMLILPYANTVLFYALNWVLFMIFYLNVILLFVRFDALHPT